MIVTQTFCYYVGKHFLQIDEIKQIPIVNKARLGFQGGNECCSVVQYTVKTSNYLVVGASHL